MKTLGRILAVSVIVLSSLSIVLGLVSIINIWRANDPLVTGLSKIANYAENALTVASNNMERVDTFLTLLQEAMNDVQKNGDELKVAIENSDPIIDTLSIVLGEDAQPKVDQALSTLAAVRSNLETFNTFTQAISALPFIELPSIGDKTQQIIDILNNVEQSIQDIQAKVELLKSGVSDAIIQPIQDQAIVVQQDLSRAQNELRDTKNQVDTALQIVLVVKPRIAAIIATISILLTVQLLWSMVSQAAMIYLSWVYLKFGRINLHLAVNPPENAAPAG